MGGVVVSLILLVLVGVEALVARSRKDQIVGFSARDTWASLGVFLGSLLTGPAAATITMVFYYRLHAAAPFKMPDAPWVFPAAVVVWDLFYYAFHRVTHEVNFFWAAHEAHHSSTHFNLSTGVRLAWWTPYTSIPFFAPMALMGFEAQLIIGASFVHALYQVLLHTELVGRLGPLEWVLNTPSHHRVHHGTEPAYVGRNLGSILILWDRLFKTFAKEQKTPSYGLVKNIERYNPLYIGLHAYLGMLRDLWRTKGLKKRWKLLGARPIAAMRAVSSMRPSRR